MRRATSAATEIKGASFFMIFSSLAFAVGTRVGYFQGHDDFSVTGNRLKSFPDRIEKGIYLPADAGAHGTGIYLAAAFGQDMAKSFDGFRQLGSP